MRLLIAACMLALAPAAGAVAHAVGSAREPDTGWSWDTLPLVCLALAGAWYLAGVLRMRRRLGNHRVIGRDRIAAFAAGMLVLFVALESPIDTISDELFSMHMVQHLLLLLAAPPLVVYGRPALVFLWALPSSARKRIGRLWMAVGLGRSLPWLIHPLPVWLLFNGAFCFWHLPGPFQLALRSEAVHTLEHLCFFVTALMFWTIVLDPSGRHRIGYGAVLVFVATTAMLSALPGALLILSSRPIYPAYAGGAAAWGMTPIEDQQLAGVIMWVPAGFVYVAAIGWTFVRWLGEADRLDALRRRRAALASVLAVMFAVACGAAQADAQSLAAAQAPDTGGDAARGARLIRDYGCGACHLVPGIEGADGMVGPPLTMVGRRVYLAGMLRNTPDDMMLWLRQPQHVVPGNAMPDMGVTARDARDIAAYLYTLR